MCDLGFYAGIEGLLGEGCYTPEMLILLREPNSPPKQNRDEKEQMWWFRSVVNGEASKTGTRYLNIYKILAGKLLGVEEEKEWLGLLKRCAYMNLRPDGGERQRSEQYYKVLAEFAELSSYEKYGISISFNAIDWKQTETAKKVAQNRMNIIQNAITLKVKFIVTTPDIYEAIRKSIKTLGESKEEEYILAKLNKSYKYCRIKETTLLSFPHPSWPRISYDEDLKNIEIKTN